MIISYGGGGASGVGITRNFETIPASTVNRTCGSMVFTDKGCDIVYFPDTDLLTGETTLAAIVVARRPKRPTAADRKAWRNRHKVIAAKTANYLSRVLPGPIGQLFEPRRIQVRYKTLERMLHVGDGAYGPRPESETLIVLFDTVAQPHVQITITKASPAPFFVPVSADSADRYAVSVTMDALSDHNDREVKNWKRDFVEGVPEVAEFVRASNEMAT